ncbi:hypothetical protein ONA91_20395 [Micromonospora sp. DR5-3]|uniref:ApeA N-terminal domain 1-containing protein n=1 Tax=unclassified Micromonospora TaxID=2617518 RepID=UPI0011D5324B|nr:MULTISPECIES: hypothetical protein [unclassified Micromonospora]MCW3816810.1 hypothetical protein [Micromonospora sp. DR5-3]TYC23714.1 hypothetical protein FXF52_14120 [Micromonospora sp. MP36]
MAKNELIVGEPRLGWFVDDPDTRRVPVMLRDTGTVVELTVAFKGFGGDGEHSRWWSSDDVMYMDDPDRTKHRYAPPRALVVEDVLGRVVLVGCRAAGSGWNAAVGQGRIVATYAVLGGRSPDYEKIHGFRTEVPALAAWTRLSGIEVEAGTDDRTGWKSVEMKLSNVEPVALAAAMNLTLASHWQTTRGDGHGEFHVHETIELETTVDEARSWDDHIAVHGAVVELASVAAWHRFGFAAVKAAGAEDRIRSATGEDLGPRWLEVSTHQLQRHEPWSSEPAFLFPYGEVGPSGVERWLTLRTDYAEALEPLLSILRTDRPWSNASVVQSGIALEKLAYLIDINKNGKANHNSYGRIHYKKGLHIILDDMAVKPFDDAEGWITRADAAYMALKHHDRPMPDTLELMNTLRENILVLRFWIGLQLGVTPESLVDGLARDDLAREFVLLE